MSKVVINSTKLYNSDMSNKILTVIEASSLLKCNPETIRRAIRNRKLKAAKIGRDYRISQQDLAQYWKEQGGGDLFDDNSTL